MAMVVVDDCCLKTGGLAAQVGWLGLRVGGRLALLYIYQMNRVNFCNDLSHGDSTINIVVVIIIIMLQQQICEGGGGLYVAAGAVHCWLFSDWQSTEVFIERPVDDPALLAIIVAKE